MAKPIFLIGVPKTTAIKNIENFQKSLEKKLEDYYTLVYLTTESEIQFKCFYEKDFDDVKFEELKQIVKENFNTILTGKPLPFPDF